MPSWEILMNEGFFIDKYGFKYDHKNESILLHYICQQLSMFYDEQPKVLEDKIWKARIKQWKHKFPARVIFFEIVIEGLSPSFTVFVCVLLKTERTQIYRSQWNIATLPQRHLETNDQSSCGQHKKG